jgi:hypothetical protein
MYDVTNTLASVFYRKYVNVKIRIKVLVPNVKSL